MNREKTFRGRFNRRVGEIKDTAGQVEKTVMDQANALAEQTRRGWKQSRRAVFSWEEQLEDSIRDHPMLYLGGAMAIIGLLIARLFSDRNPK